MIVPMTRYDFLLYHADVESFMEHLLDLGVVDITHSGWQANPQQRELIAQADQYRTSSHELEAFTKARIKRENEEITAEVDLAKKSAKQAGVAAPSKIEPITTDVAPFDSAQAAVVAYVAASEKLDHLVTERMKAKAELDKLEIWGQFDPSMVARLKRDAGITLRFFEIPSKRYSADLEAEYPIEVIVETVDKIYFILAQSDREPILEIEQATEHRAPTTSFALQESYIEQIIAQEAEQIQVIARAAQSRDLIDAAYVKLRDQLDFSRALDTGERLADDSLRLVTGYAVTDLQSSIEEFADQQDVIFTSRAAVVADDPPIKLRNNFFARLFEPVGALYMLPKYDELDMTPFFAPFFMIFFGVCFGDAGYGMLLLLAIAFMWKRLPTNYLDYARFGIWLGASTVVFGFLTGNMFGIELVKVKALVAFKEYFISPENMFNVAIAMGAVQILFGQVLRVFNRIKRGGSFTYGLSSIGWVILLFSISIAFLGFIPGFAMGSTAFMVALAIAGVLILFFNSPGKNPFVNLGAGLYSCYEMATGVVGDLVSYVRLFAIGLSGCIIAQVFNALAEGMSGDIPGLNWLIMTIILLIGHAMTIFISILGAFVHPVRLTFVEFYKNAEFGGGGRAFTPFRKN